LPVSLFSLRWRTALADQARANYFVLIRRKALLFQKLIKVRQLIIGDGWQCGSAISAIKFEGWPPILWRINLWRWLQIIKH